MSDQRAGDATLPRRPGDTDADALMGRRPSVVVIDLDAPGAGAGELPLAWAGVAVGVSRDGWPARAGEGPVLDLSTLDMVLVPSGETPDAPSPGAAWVGVEDVDAELDRIGLAAAQSPVATATLMQLLRAGVASSVQHDLFVESLAYSELQAGDEHARWLDGRPEPKARHPQAGEPVELERDDRVLTVTLNRPHVRNAYNVEIRDGLFEAFELVALDPSIERVILRGAGPSFCSGGDLDEFGTGPSPAVSHLIRTGRGPARGLARVADRVVAHLHGSCVGAGIELPSFAGRVVAAPDARFRLPEVGMGLIPGAGGTASIPRRVGRHRMAWFSLTGAWLDVSTALAWGLVDEVGDSATS